MSCRQVKPVSRSGSTTCGSRRSSDWWISTATVPSHRSKRTRTHRQATLSCWPCCFGLVLLSSPSISSAPPSTCSSGLYSTAPFSCCSRSPQRASTSLRLLGSRPSRITRKSDPVFLYLMRIFK